MEIDPKKILEKRLKMRPMTSEEFRQQFERNQRDALRFYEMEKQKRSETSRVRED